MSISRHCPICRFTRARPVWHEAQLRYVRCGRCGLVFSDVDAATYARDGHNSWHEPEVTERTRAFYGLARSRAHERFLSRFPPVGERRLLDVGCGLGYFMTRAASAGWIAHGCDTSIPWLQRAAEATGTPERLACSEPRGDLFRGSFDMITVWDVLEHVYEPLPFLQAIADLLAPDGRLFLRTPNLLWVYPTYAVRRGLFGSDVVLGPLNHVVYYTSGSLRRTLQTVGLAPIDWPVLPPPQVPLRNRRPERAGERSVTTALKNAHAAAAELVSRATGGMVVIGADLDVVAVRAR